MIFEKEGRRLSLEEFEKVTESSFVSKLDFEFHVLIKIVKECAKYHRKGYLTREQLWLGSYFKKELTELAIPDVTIRWIDETLGWGVFANRDLKPMTFIAEYTGQVRKRRRSDAKNGYCFEYIIAQGSKTPYTIDAQKQGGIARFINHSEKGNLIPNLATFDNVSHVVLYVKEGVRKGEQLCYDYGPDYWKRRKAPLDL
ncbi:MAG TPA: SET domain-containing protein [Chlamydiales bacterium]|nr:SET domain-containing protein [Chlamydiales bacterium]